MPGSSKPLRKLMVAIGGSPDKFRAKLFPTWLLSDSAKVCYLAMLYIIASASLIQSNRWVLSVERFPFPDALCITQQAVTTCVAWGLFFAKQSWFPTAEVLWNESGLSALKGRLTSIGAAYAVSSFCMVIAYGDCSRSVVAMVQDCNLPIVFFLTMYLGIDRLPGIASLTIMGAFVGSVMVSFTFSPIRWTQIGIVAEIASQMLLLGCIVAQDIIMNRQQQGVMLVDPRSLVLLVAPSSLLITTLIFLSSHFGRYDLEPYWTPFVWYWPFVMFNGVLAFVITVTTSYIIKYCGALGFLIVGMLSNLLIVIGTSLSIHGLNEMIHSRFGCLELSGFILASCGIVQYCIIKWHPDCFEPGSHLHGFLRAYRRIYLGISGKTEYSIDICSAESHERQHLLDHA